MRIFRTWLKDRGPVDVDVDTAKARERDGAQNALEVAAKMRIYLAELLAPYGQAERVAVEVCEVKTVIVEGSAKVSLGSLHSVSVPLPQMRMDEAWFTARQSELLLRLPPEFQSWAGTAAWERGHSSGYEEVLSVLEELVTGLEPCIRGYAKRVMEEK